MATHSLHSCNTVLSAPAPSYSAPHWEAEITNVWQWHSRGQKVSLMLLMIHWTQILEVKEQQWWETRKKKKKRFKLSKYINNGTWNAWTKPWEMTLNEMEGVKVNAVKHKRESAVDTTVTAGICKHSGTGIKRACIASTMHNDLLLQRQRVNILKGTSCYP